MKPLEWLRIALAAAALGASGLAAAQANLTIDTPAITALRTTLRDEYKQLRPYFENGAVGLARDGTIMLRDANLIPLAQRAQVNAVIAQGNRDRGALYREIAIANGHPEWEGDIRSTFARRWAERAPAGWWFQNETGAWVQK